VARITPGSRVHRMGDDQTYVVLRRIEDSPTRWVLWIEGTGIELIAETHEIAIIR
jgi:hypothetical protein